MYGINLQNGALIFDVGNGSKVTFSTIDVAQDANPVAGVWYDTEGMFGTVTFYNDGILVCGYAPNGVTLIGTYVFDASSGTGSATFNFPEGAQTYNMTLSFGILTFDNEPGSAFSRNFVVQTS